MVFAIRLIISLNTFITADFSPTRCLMLWLVSGVNTNALLLLFVTILYLFRSSGTSIELIEFDFAVCIILLYSGGEHTFLRYG